ncbi:MAG: 6-phosphogluconate dehydrogenase [Desulfuromonadaceae bacterium]
MTGEEIRKKAVRIVAVLIVAAVVLSAGYVMIALNWSYSKGERIGYVQKFSEKGWLCKTWEGELQMLPVPGAMPEKFLFSVRDKTVIGKITSSMGKKASITYEQHKGIPTTCFGESEYFAVDARALE